MTGRVGWFEHAQLFDKNLVTPSLRFSLHDATQGLYILESLRIRYPA